MRTTKCLPCVLLLTCGLATAYGGDAAKSPQPAGSTQPKDKNLPSQADTYVLSTGSHIKTTVKRHGQITDGPSQVLVIDQKTIANSGASTLRQLLARQGVGR